MIATALIVLCLCLPLTSRADSPRQIAKQIAPSVVSITTYDVRGNPLSFGTGFVIGPRRVVTNLHVLSGASKAEVQTHDGRKHPVKDVLGKDDDWDILLLTIDVNSDELPPLQLEPKLPDLGEHIISNG